MYVFKAGDHRRPTNGVWLHLGAFSKRVVSLGVAYAQCPQTAEQYRAQMPGVDTLKSLTAHPGRTSHSSGLAGHSRLPICSVQSPQKMLPQRPQTWTLSTHPEHLFHPLPGQVHVEFVEQLQYLTDAQAAIPILVSLIKRLLQPLWG